MDPEITPQEDDFSAAYMARREDMGADADISELDALLAPVTPGQEKSASANVDNPAAMQKADQMRQFQSGVERPEAGMGSKVLKDVGLGAIEAPAQVVNGIRDAIQSTVELISDSADWRNQPGVKEALAGNFDDPRLDKLGVSPKAESDGVKKLPEIPGLGTNTGKMVRSVSKFLAGFAGAGKLLKAPEAVTQAGKFGLAMTKGAIADFTVFDPHEQRLADLVQEFPQLQNPVTEYLASDPTDSEAEGRFKNAIEGLGLGVLTEGFAQGVKALRNVNWVKRTAADAGLPVHHVKRVRPENFSALGDPESSQRVMRKVSTAVKETKGGPKPGGEEMFINWARIDAPEDIQAVMKDMADGFKKPIDKARRGVRTWGKTKLSAEQVDAWDTLMKRRTGEAMNAEQSLAARQLWVSSAGKLREVATAAANDPSEANLFAFRKMLATHHAIQKEVIAARTETARALNAWKIPAGGSEEVARQIDTLLEQSGGTDVARELASRISVLSEVGMARELDKVVELGAFARTRDAVAQAWINGLLSNPTTHIVNAMSNWSVIFQQMYERKAASYISNLLGTEGGVEVGEATAQMFGLVEGMKDALRISAKGRRAAMTAGKTLLKGDLRGAQGVLRDNAAEFGGTYRTLATGRSGYGLGKVDLPRQGAFSSETWNVASDTWAGRALDVIDTATEMPGRMLATSDEFFKSIGYRMELHAQALRQAASEVREGVLDPNAMKSRIQAIIENPPENIRISSADAATYQTFTKRPAAVPKALGDATQKVPVFGRLVLPFKNTPINIMTYTFERTPLAPLVKEWRADIAMGGARRDIALGRMATGTALLATAMDLALSGVITGEGPTAPGERGNFNRQGKQKYSVKVEDRWYSFSRADPIGMTLGLGADLVEVMANAQESDKEMEAAVAASALAIAKNVTSKTYLQGISNFFEAVSDPDRYGLQYFEGIAGSFVPAGVAAAARLEDPYMRSASDIVDSIKRRTPWWNQDLPLYRDLWGRPVDYRSGLGVAYDALSPIYTKVEDPEPIDKELERLEYFPSMPDRRTTFNGVTIDMTKYPEAYSRYVELAGNELKDPAWGMGAKDMLNAIVSGDHELSPIYRLYSDGPDGGKAGYIRTVLNGFRKRARDQVLAEFGELRAEYESKRKLGSKLDPQVLGLR